MQHHPVWECTIIHSCTECLEIQRNFLYINLKPLTGLVHLLSGERLEGPSREALPDAGSIDTEPKNGWSNRMKRCYLGVLVACFLLFSAQAVFSAQTVFTPSISISEEYTSNVQAVDDNNQETEEDYITVISPNFSLSFLERKGSLVLSYSPSYSIYANDPDLNTFRHSASLSGEFSLSKHTTLTFSDTPSLTEDPLNLTDTTIRRNRDKYFSNSGSVGLSHRFGKSHTLRLGYVNTILDNDDPLQEDSVEHSPSVDVTFAITPQWRFETGVAYTKGLFESALPEGAGTSDFDRVNGYVGVSHDFTRHFSGNIRYSHTYFDENDSDADYHVFDPSVGFTWRVTDDTTLSLNVGYYFRDNNVGEDDDDITINGNIAKTWRIKRGSFTVSGGSGYDQSFFGAENLGFHTFYTANGQFAYEFTKRINGHVFGSYQQDTYTDESPERKDDTVNVGVGFSWVILPWLSSGLDISHRVVDSNIVGNDLEESRVFFRISMSPERPWKKTIERGPYIPTALVPPPPAVDAGE